MSRPVRLTPPKPTKPTDPAAIDKWTEQPARLAAEALAQDAQTPEVRGEVGAGVENGATGRKSRSAKPAPWDDVVAVTESDTKLRAFNLPNRLYRELKYVADTTFGETMTSIVVAGIRMRLDEMHRGKK